MVYISNEESVQRVWDGLTLRLLHQVWTGQGGKCTVANLAEVAKDEPRSSLGGDSHDRRSPSRERCVRHPPPAPRRRRPPPPLPRTSYPASTAPLSEQQECGIVPALTPCCCASAARCCCRHCCFYLRELVDRIRASSPSMPHRWRGVDLLSQIGRVRNSPSCISIFFVPHNHLPVQKSLLEDTTHSWRRQRRMDRSSHFGLAPNAPIRPDLATCKRCLSLSSLFYSVLTFR